MRIRLQLASIGVVAALLGCASSDNAPEPADLPRITEFNQLPELWHRRVGKGGEYVFAPWTAENGVVYAVSANGVLEGYELASGKQVLSLKTERPVSAGVGGDDQALYLGTSKGEILAYGFDGRPKWSARVGSEVLVPPKAALGLVIVRVNDGSVVALDARDGSRKWSYQRSLPSLTLRAQGPVLLAGRKVVVGMPGGKLVALSIADGGLLWEATIAQPRGATELERIADIASAPVSDGRMVCAVAFQGRLACVDAEAGNPLWSREVASSYGVGIDMRNVYVTDELGAVAAFDKQTGRNLWKQGRLYARAVTAPAVFGRFVAVGDYEGYVHLLSAEDGSFLSRADTDGSAIRQPPLPVQEKLLLQTAKGGVYLLDIK